MLKFAVFLLIGFLIYIMFVKKKKSPSSHELIECKKCGTFVEKTELKNGVCSECKRG